MKSFFAFCFLLFTTNFAVAQPQQNLYAIAKQLMQNGDYENAALTLYKLLLNEPNNVAAQKDFVIANYYKKDYTKSIEIAEKMIKDTVADEQVYQVLAWNYKTTNNYKDCNRVYKDGLNKFPKSGVLYNDYAELNYVEKKPEEAIKNWEKGIEVEPNYPNNFYNAAMYYNQNNNIFWSLIYGEIFINLESYTLKTAEIKSIVAEAYKKLLYIKNDELNIKNSFEKAVMATLGYTNESITPATLTAIRTKFILHWFYDDSHTKFPYRLFDQQRFLLSQGLFDAYNQWLFGITINPAQYKIWADSHKEEVAAFKQFQESRVFKNTVGEYYR